MKVDVLSLVPRKLRFESRLAYRHLISGGGQTILTISAVAAGVIIVVFITSLIFGLQGLLTTLLTENIPHVTVRVPELKPVPLNQIPGAIEGPVSSRIEQQAPQQKQLENWQQIVSVITNVPNVRIAVPAVSGQGFASKGGNPYGVSVTGADPELQDQVVPITKNLIAGHFIGLTSQEIVIDAQLAKDLNVPLGDRIRLTSSAGNSDSFTVAGIYDLGQGRGNAYLTLRTAQSLFGMGASVNVIFVKVNDIYRADTTSQQIRLLLPYDARSWIEDFPQFLSSLQVQTASAYLISVFSLVASAFAIAAVLIVSVLQKSKEIGILKSMGARRRQILRVFLLEGLGIAIVGSFVGAALGAMIVFLLSLIKAPSSVTKASQTSQQLFPVAILPKYLVIAMVAATVATVIAAILPARRAAKLNPIDIMR